MNAATDTNRNALFAKALRDLAADMRSRGLGAILWDNSRAGFHFLPAVQTGSGEASAATVVAEGLYLYGDTVYILEEGVCPLSVSNLYDPDTEVKPVVVTLDRREAERLLGNPEAGHGFTTAGTLEEWLAVTDCYFEALNMDAGES